LRILKRKKSLGPYVPKRANATEKANRAVAAVLPNQHQLEAYLMRCAESHPDEKARQLRRAIFDRIKPHLKFRAVRPWFLDSEGATATKTV
jgi:hypothetical protein